MFQLLKASAMLSAQAKPGWAAILSGGCSPPHCDRAAPAKRFLRRYRGGTSQCAPDFPAGVDRRNHSTLTASCRTPASSGRGQTFGPAKPENADRYSWRQPRKSADERARSIRLRPRGASWVGALRQDGGSLSPERIGAGGPGRPFAHAGAGSFILACSLWVRKLK